MTGSSLLPSVLLGVLLTGALGCGSSTTTAPSPSPSSDAGTSGVTCAAAPYQDRGPYAVGVTTLDVGGIPTEVWYPVEPRDAAGKPRASYDMRDWLPPADRAKISDADTPLHETSAVRDLPLAKGERRPVLLFSHGLGGYRLQSTFLTTHLASWGFVVVAPDHPERGLAIVVAGDLTKVDVSKAPDQLRAALARMKQEDGDAGSRFAGALDFTRIGTFGHSMGGNTAALVGADAEVKATVLLAAPGPATALGKPLLMMWGAVDGVAKPSSVQSSFDRQSAPKRALSLRGAGHLAFTDLCTIAADKGGVLQVAIDHGIAVDDLVKQLGSDGCGAQKDGTPYLAPEAGWAPIDHYVTATFRSALGIDPKPIGLDGAAAACFGDRIASSDAQP